MTCDFPTPPGPLRTTLYGSIHLPCFNAISVVLHHFQWNMTMAHCLSFNFLRIIRYSSAAISCELLGPFDSINALVDHSQ